MSATRLFTRTSALTRASPSPLLASSLPRRTLSTTPSRLLKESSEADPEANERHKQDSIAKQKQGKGHWKPELASNSEESIKADRAPKSDMKTLQEETKGHAEETRKHGTSMKDM